jgi:hypothetical protein
MLKNAHIAPRPGWRGYQCGCIDSRGDPPVFATRYFSKGDTSVQHLPFEPYGSLGGEVPA